MKDERHLLIDCSFYQDKRISLFDKANSTEQQFRAYDNLRMTMKESLSFFLLSNVSVVKDSAKACHDIVNGKHLYT